MKNYLQRLDDRSRISMQDTGAVPVASTNYLQNFRGRTRIDWCNKSKWRDRCANDLNRKKTINANDNEAFEDYALAA